MNYKLCQLKFNEIGIIKTVNTDQETKNRLQSLGIVPGTEITPLFSTPLNSPTVYRYLNTMIAIRNDIATKIIVLAKEKNE